ncbi:MAG: two-component regulator propeller domain-containing protein [Saprospiraceae bacterium]
MKVRYLLIFSFLLVWPWSLQAQTDYTPGIRYDLTLRFEAIGSEHGLPHKTIHALFQDHMGFIWLGTPIGLVKYDGYQFQTFKYQTSDSIAHLEGRSRIHVSSIAEDPNGDLWVGCRFEHPDQPVLFRFDREKEVLIPQLFDQQKNTTIIRENIQKIQIGAGFIWILANRLNRLPIPLSDETEKAVDEKDLVSFDKSAIINIYKDSREQLWFPGQNGIYRWITEPDSLQFYPIPLPPEIQKPARNVMYNILETRGGKLLIFPVYPGYLLRFDPIDGSYETVKKEGLVFKRHLLQMSPEQLWFGKHEGRGGMHIFDLENFKISQVDIQVDGHLFFPTARIHSFLKDDTGNVWVGTQDGPLLKYEPQRNNFHWLHFEAEHSNTLPHNSISAVKQDQKGNYWITSFGGGLSRWDRQKNTFTHFRAQPDRFKGPLSDFLLGLEITPDGKTWFGEGFSAGSYDPASGQFKHYEESGTVWTVYGDSQKRIWLAKFGGGLRRYDPGTDDFIPIGMPDPNDTTRTIFPFLGGIYEDSRGDLWLGSHSPGMGGFFRFDPETEHFEVFKMPEAHAFWEDRRGYIWIGSVNGLYRFDPKNGQFKLYLEEDGLSNNAVNAIIEDEVGYIWMATDNGLSRFDPAVETFRNYFQRDGLPSNSFFEGAYKNEEGELFFWGNFGLLYFHPDSIRENEILPRLAFTGMDLFGEPIQIGENGPLQKHISLTEEIHLAHWQNDLTIHYAALHYKNPTKNQYQVQLVNYHDSWQGMEDQRFTNFTNLSPNSYTFRVRAANSDGVWNEEGIALRIIIYPPWYWNSWSQLLYLALTSGLILGIYRFQLNRRLTLAEASRLLELDELKNRLYTNITHEFRTPLTVIQGLASQIKGYEEEKKGIQQNSNNLLTLITRLLDLSKLEAGKLELQLVHGDIIPFLRYVTESFHSYALNRKINLNFYTGEEQVNMDFDADNILQVLSNLLSNALKFTPEYGKVQVVARKILQEKQPMLELKISDTGIGISQEELPKIFDRFFQADMSNTRRAEGTGIGLALVKEHVELMDGRIVVESQEGEGTSFIVVLPVRQEAPVEDVMNTRSFAITDANDTQFDHQLHGALPHRMANEGETSAELPLLLIVEDNRDVMRYLASCLQNDYQLLYARNGREGIEEAIQQVPDIIISDVMMPEVDGFELCQTLKTDERTSHIPIILLTAKADLGSRIEGLETGADAYLAKPFDKKELLVRLQKLIELRQKLQNRYRQLGLVPLAKGIRPNREDDFLKKISEAIEAHLDDEQFGVEQLCRDIGVSRIQLYRKLKALTNWSPAQLILQTRLQTARQLLFNTDLQVGEVAGQVGFKDHSHFTKLYKEAFGELPSATSKKRK